MHSETAARVFVTGGAGFIGSHVVEALAPCNTLAVYDSLSPRIHRGSPGNLARVRAAGARFFLGDICDGTALRDALALFRPDIVLHLAAETGTGESHDRPAHYCQVNVGGTAALVEAVRAVGGVRRIILASSRAVYGEGAYCDEAGRAAQPMPRTQAAMQAGDFAVRDAKGTELVPMPTAAPHPAAPMSIYASSKLMQEHLLTQAFWGSDTEVAILRLQNVYGPNQSLTNPYTGVLSTFARQMLEGARLELFEDGCITRDFLFVRDAAEAFVAAVQAAALPSMPLDIGAGQPVLIRDVARAMLAAVGQDPGRTRVTGRFRAGDIRHAVADTRQAQGALCWHARTGLTEGLGHLLGWSQAECAA